MYSRNSSFRRLREYIIIKMEEKMAQGFLLKYAEIGGKGKNRYKFEDALCNQIRLRLSEIVGECTVE